MYLDLLHTAVLFRTAWQNRTAVLRFRDRLDDALSNEDARLVSSWVEWTPEKHCSVVILANALLTQGAVGLRRPAFLSQGRSVQQAVYMHLMGRETAPSASDVLARRLGRWRLIAHNPPFPRILAARAIAILRRLANAPGATRWAVVRLWLNGWTTARRFQQQASCVLCAGGEDSVEHLALCPVVRDVALRNLRITFSSSEPLHFLLLGVAPRREHTLLAHAALLPGLHLATNSIRHGARSTTDSNNFLWAWVRHVGVQHPRLGHAIRTQRFEVDY